jgi:hypothetical protein
MTEHRFRFERFEPSKQQLAVVFKQGRLQVEIQFAVSTKTCGEVPVIPN